VVDSGLPWKGICDFAKEISLRLHSNVIVQLDEAASSSEAGYDAMKKLLPHRSCFTVLMSFDDMTAFGAIRALTQAGLGVSD
jgi:DNA-binding LacI/PurR family transcriptional regulator